MEELLPVPFYFLRHGATDWNVGGLSQGRTNVPLNAAGIAQGQAAARLLKGHGIRAIVVSTLHRAQQTAALVGEALGIEPTSDEGLQEASFGSQEGQPMGSWYDEWVAGSYTPEGAETFAALRSRVVPALDRALRLPGPVLVIAHGAMFRAVRAAMGLSALVRTDNGVPLHCEPGSPWVLTPVE